MFPCAFKNSPPSREGLGVGLRLFLFLLHGVQRQLLYLATLQELLRAVAAAVRGALRHEDHVQTRDVLGDAVLGGGLCTLRLDADLERTEAVQLHALGVLHLVLVPMQAIGTARAYHFPERLVPVDWS